MRIRGLKPTRRQKLAIVAAKLNPDNWLIVKQPAGKLEIVHRKSGKVRTIPA